MCPQTREFFSTAYSSLELAYIMLIFPVTSLQ